jgi:hypothetical protein
MKIAGQMKAQSDLYVLDSMPLEVCKLSRANRSNIFQEADVQSPLENGILVSDEGYLSHSNSDMIYFSNLP